MELAMIGLGKMGLNMATRLVRGGHRVVGFASAAFESIELDVPATVITLALQMRFASRDEQNFSARMLTALRDPFGAWARGDEIIP